jgi:hypothetical protein
VSVTVTGSRFFEDELATRTRSIDDVLVQWVPRFVHAVDALMFHGLIRTAHAVRALDHRDTRVRRGEFARGLALWAYEATDDEVFLQAIGKVRHLHGVRNVHGIARAMLGRAA